MQDTALTCRDLQIRTPQDARIVFHAVALNLLPMITRRLGPEERHQIRSGSVFVWEERGSNSDSTGIGIERWTDGYRWGPSRVRDGFLFYEEKRSGREKSKSPYLTDSPLMSKRQDSSLLFKQTYTVWVNTNHGRKKWHLISYFTDASVPQLLTVEQYPALHNIDVPPGIYPSARQPKGREPGREDYTSSSWVSGPANSDPQSPPFTTSRFSTTEAPIEYAPQPQRHRNVSPPSQPHPASPLYHPVPSVPLNRGQLAQNAQVYAQHYHGAPTLRPQETLNTYRAESMAQHNLNMLPLRSSMSPALAPRSQLDEQLLSALDRRGPPQAGQWKVR